MTLSNKQKALLATLGLVLGSTAVGFLMQFVADNVSPQTVMYVVGLSFIGWMLYIVYAILLARFEYQDSIKNLTGK